MRPSRIVRVGVVAVALAITGAVDAARYPARGQAPKLEAVLEPFEAWVEQRSYRTFAGDGRPLGRTRWRLVTGTGNDRENYVATTAAGMLLDFGGEWLRVSEDEGLTWHSVMPPEELREWWSYEGAVAVAPGGDVVAAGQDAVVSGVLRAMTFKYEAEAGKWFYSFAESSSPFLDRPAVGVLPGPFEIAGTTVPYVSVLRGGLLASKSYWSYSLDGLNYGIVDNRFADAVSSAPETAPLQVEEWDELDWIQSHELAGIAPLGHGRALAERPQIGAFDTESHAPRTVLDPATLRWKPLEWPAGGPPQTSVANCVDGTNWPPCFLSEGRTLADSRGNLHHVSYGEEGIRYWFSDDGGATWTKSVTPLLAGYTPPFQAELAKSFKVSGRHGKTVVVVHAIESRDPVVTRDLVYVFDSRSGAPRVKKIHVLGDGGSGCFSGGSDADLQAAACDFPSVALLPDGRIVASFTDAAHREPALAIELPRKR